MADRCEILDLPDSDHWAPEQALAVAGKTGWEQVLIVGWSDKGELLTLNSRMTLGETLFLLKSAEYRTMGVG